MANENYNVIVVEDDSVAAAATVAAVNAYPDHEKLTVQVLDNPHSLEAFVASQNSPIDIVLMDINLDMSDTTGIDLVEKLFPAHSGTQTIYVTGYIEYCTRVYKTDHVYFLTKPVRQDDINDALDKALERVRAFDDRPLLLTVGSRVMSLAPHQIEYVESDRRKVRVHMGNDVVETYALLTNVLHDLPHSFLHCHKSFIVNMDYITEFGVDHVILRSGIRIPVSQRRRKKAHDTFLCYLGSR